MNKAASSSSYRPRATCPAAFWGSARVASCGERDKFMINRHKVRCQSVSSFDKYGGDFDACWRLNWYLEAAHGPGEVAGLGEFLRRLATTVSQGRARLGRRPVVLHRALELAQGPDRRRRRVVPLRTGGSVGLAEAEVGGGEGRVDGGVVGKQLQSRGRGRGRGLAAAGLGRALGLFTPRTHTHTRTHGQLGSCC